MIGLIAVAASPESTLGIYERFQGAPDAAPFGKAAKDQLTGLLAMAAVLPVAIVAAGSVRGEAWRDSRLGPLLAVTWAAVLAFLAQSAWTLTTVLDDGLVPWHIQRYVEYTMPLLLVAMTVVIMWRRVALRELSIAGAVATLVLLATPGVRDVQEERGLFGIQERVNSILGTSAGVSLALVSALLVAIAVGATARLRDRPVAVLGVVSGSILVVFLVQAQILWPWQKETTNNFRAGFPASLSWVDDADRGDVARMIVVDNPTRGDTTHFFNYDIDRVYTPPQDQYFGRRCQRAAMRLDGEPGGSRRLGRRLRARAQARPARQRLLEGPVPRPEGARDPARDRQARRASGDAAGPSAPEVDPASPLRTAAARDRDRRPRRAAAAGPGLLPPAVGRVLAR